MTHYDVCRLPMWMAPFVLVFWGIEFLWKWLHKQISISRRKKKDH
jgi:hypothetical protein